jgi:hypothetical protein
MLASNPKLAQSDLPLQEAAMLRKIHAYFTFEDGNLELNESKLVCTDAHHARQDGDRCVYFHCLLGVLVCPNCVRSRTYDYELVTETRVEAGLGFFPLAARSLRRFRGHDLAHWGSVQATPSTMYMRCDVFALVDETHPLGLDTLLLLNRHKHVRDFPIEECAYRPDAALVNLEKRDNSSYFGLFYLPLRDRLDPKLVNIYVGDQRCCAIFGGTSDARRAMSQKFLRHVEVERDKTTYEVREVVRKCSMCELRGNDICLLSRNEFTHYQWNLDDVNRMCIKCSANQVCRCTSKCGKVLDKTFFEDRIWLYRLNASEPPICKLCASETWQCSGCTNELKSEAFSHKIWTSRSAYRQQNKRVLCLVCDASAKRMRALKRRKTGKRKEKKTI